MSKKKKEEKRLARQVENLAPNKVQMVFKENKFYNDLNKPHFEAGKVYTLEGAAWIQRWLKRGGKIVSGDLSFPPPAPANPSEIVKAEAKKKEEVSAPAPVDKEPLDEDSEEVDNDLLGDVEEEKVTEEESEA